MKQLLFMLAVTGSGIFGVFVVGPFSALAAYYFYAVLRPQYIWKWSLPPDMQWSMFVAVAAIVGTAFWLLRMTPDPWQDEKAPRGPFWWGQAAPLAFFAWLFIAYFDSIDRSVAYPWLIEYMKIFTMMTVATIVIVSPKQVRILYFVAAGAISYIAWEVNSLYLFQGGYLGIYHNGYGGLDNNGAGLMLAMGVPLCYFAWMGERSWWRWGFAAAIPVLLHATLLTYSRGAWVSLIAVVPLIVIRSRKRLQLVMAAVGMAILLPILAGQEIRDEFFSVKQYQEDASAQSRFDSWRAAWLIALDHPVAGSGIRNSNLISHQYGADLEGRTIHSQLLQLMADTGFTGLALYLATLAGAAVALRKVRKAARVKDAPDAHHQAYEIAAGLEAALVVFLVGSLFLSLEVFELPWLVLAMAAALPRTLGLAETTSQVLVPSATQRLQRRARTVSWRQHASPRRAYASRRD